MPSLATALASAQVEMPDVASHRRAEIARPLDLVGMENVEFPARIQYGAGLHALVTARADAFVSLDSPRAKGIHMSRMFLVLQEAFSCQDISFSALRAAVSGIVASQRGLSRSGHISLRFKYPVLRPALRSRSTSWKTYAVQLSATLEPHQSYRCEMIFTVLYSSTCPCSASLARQLIQNAFRKKFGSAGYADCGDVETWLGTEDGICATPHSQRSSAEVHVVVSDDCAEFPLLALIDKVENSLGTPVQTFVRRVDEREFTSMNGSNLMFCEDAVRRVGFALDSEPLITDYRVRVVHQESLHPHDATSVIVKGVQNGLRPRY